jgi:hypothetical protein
MKTSLTRRDWLRLTAAGIVGYSMSGWLERLAAATGPDPKRRRSCILLWMNGGPSQMDTFDLKPGHANGGPYKPIETSVTGIQISEHLPKIARHMQHMAILRSMASKEGDHGRASFLLRTGYLQQGPVQYPTLGSLLSKELGDEKSELPNFVSIAPYRFFNQDAYGPGFLGPQYAPLIVGDTGIRFNQQQGQNNYDSLLKVQDLAPPAEVTREQTDARIDLLQEMEREFIARHPGVAPQSHRTAYDRAVRLMRTEAAKAFDLEEESAGVRDAYGRNLFGQGCLLARRLVERNVPFVEVTLGGFSNNFLGWDTHAQNFTAVKALSEILDPAWAQLMTDLKERGRLDDTLIVWMGEFGRTPKINGGQGRDHWPNTFSTVLAGGGIEGGQVIGATTDDGMAIKDRPVTVPQLLATVCQALGIDHQKQNMSNVGRPIRITDHGTQPVQEALP